MQIATLQFSHNDLPGLCHCNRRAGHRTGPTGGAAGTAGMAAGTTHHRDTPPHYTAAAEPLQPLRPGTPDRRTARRPAGQRGGAGTRSFREFGNTRHLLLALDLQVRQQQWQPARQLLDNLDKGTARAALADSASFWSLSSANPLPDRPARPGARPLAPGNRPRSGQRRTAPATTVAADRQPRVRRTAAAAGCLAPMQPATMATATCTPPAIWRWSKAQQALPWFAAYCRIKHQDPLWLTGYADALEQALQPDLAWPRATPCLELAAATASGQQAGPVAASGTAGAVVHARLGATRALRQLLRQDQAAGDGAGSAQVAELALVWALSTRRDVLAHAAGCCSATPTHNSGRTGPSCRWRWQQRDQVELQRLLEQHLHELPVNDAIEAAHRPDNWRWHSGWPPNVSTCSATMTPAMRNWSKPCCKAPARSISAAPASASAGSTGRPGSCNGRHRWRRTCT